MYHTNKKLKWNPDKISTLTTSQNKYINQIITLFHQIGNKECLLLGGWVLGFFFFLVLLQWESRDRKCIEKPEKASFIL